MENFDEDKDSIYCSECGSRIRANADFCESCGAPRVQSEIKYVKTRNTGSSFGKAVAIILGGFFIIIGIPILFGGGALIALTDHMDQGGGFIGIDDIRFGTGTQALIVKNMDIYYNDYEGPHNWIWAPDFSDWATIKIKAESISGENIFIGIIEAADGFEVFNDIAYEQITEFDMERPRNQNPYIEYRYHPGGQMTEIPTELDIWVASVYGSGEQTLTWSPEFGNFWVVVMNEDSSPNLSIDAGVAVKIPIMDNIGRGLFIGGLVLLGIGIAIIFFGVINPRN
jgi:hypothetical protein